MGWAITGGNRLSGLTMGHGYDLNWWGIGKDGQFKTRVHQSRHSMCISTFGIPYMDGQGWIRMLLVVII